MDRDPNRGRRAVPLVTFTAADLLGLNDDEPCVCDTDFSCMADGHTETPRQGGEAPRGAEGDVFAPLDVVMEVAEKQMAKWKTTLDWLAER